MLAVPSGASRGCPLGAEDQFLFVHLDCVIDLFGTQKLSGETKMPPVAAPAAAAISVRATLEILDGPFALMAAGVAQDTYALWLGSGLSLGRLPGLKILVMRVLDFLQRQITDDPRCRFRRSLTHILILADAEWERIDFETPVHDWLDIDTICRRLVTNYARMLDTPVEHEEVDYLLWNGVDVPGTYADPTTLPDAEHYCIAVLALEGVASNIASANWDGLVERATEELSGDIRALLVCVLPEDTRLPALRSRLYKFHGCAVRARNDPTTYRPKLVGRQSQINGWTAHAENVVIAQKLIDLVTSKPTLMVGLSAQDANIQGIFAAAQARMEWPWPSNPPAYVFSENTLGADQMGLLQNVYLRAYTAATRQEIYEKALIQAYAKPLLLALILHVLCAKLGTLVDLIPSLSPDDRVTLRGGLVALRNVVAETVAPGQHLAFIDEFVRVTDRLISLFRDGKIPLAGSKTYRPLWPSPIQQFAGDPSLPASGLREFAVGASLFGIGLRQGLWTLAMSDRADPKSGAFRVEAVGGSTSCFFTANSHAALLLQVNGHVAENDNAVIIHSLEIVPRMARSPRGTPGRTGQVGLREVSILQLMEGAANAGELMKRFREDTAI